MGLSHLSHVSILFLVKYDKTETNWKCVPADLIWMLWRRWARDVNRRSAFFFFFSPAKPMVNRTERKLGSYLIISYFNIWPQIFVWQSSLYFKNDLPPVGNILPPTGYAICDCTLPWFLILRSIVTIGKVMIHLQLWTAQCTLTVSKQILERNAKRIWISDIYGFTRLKLPMLCWEYCVMCNMLPLALGTPLAPMTVQLLHNPEHRKSTFHLQFNKYIHMDTESMYGSSVSFFDQRLYGRTDCSLSKNDVHWKCQNVNMSKVSFLQLKTAGGQVSCPLRGGGLQYLQQMEHLRALTSQPNRNY